MLSQMLRTAHQTTERWAGLGVARVKESRQAPREEVARLAEVARLGKVARLAEVARLAKVAAGNVAQLLVVPAASMREERMVRLVSSSVEAVVDGGGAATAGQAVEAASEEAVLLAARGLASQGTANLVVRAVWVQGGRAAKLAGGWEGYLAG